MNPQMSGCYAFGLVEILPLLIQVADKSHLNVNTLSDRLLSEIVNVCARTQVELRCNVDMEDCVVVSLQKRSLALSRVHTCRLRELIFSACLFRTYAYMGSPEVYDLDTLLSENWLMLADELPQSLTYSTTADVNEHVFARRSHHEFGEADIHLHAA